MQRLRLGMLTPSSNTALEPATYRLLAGTPQASAHFARFPVTEIGLSKTALGQFDTGPILAAADLLSHAKVDVIAWNGTSASWLGFERDTELCAAITRRTGIAATTAILAMNELYKRLGLRHFGLVTPYTTDVQQRIIANYASAGWLCAAEAHANLSDNFSFATLAPERIAAMIEQVAEAKPEAIAVVCTNMDAALTAAGLEQKLGIPVLDSIAVTLWGTLDWLGRDKTPWRRFGRLFEL
jgi:maleate isomerase